MVSCAPTKGELQLLFHLPSIAWCRHLPRCPPAGRLPVRVCPGLITLLDGTDVNALRRARFHRSDDNGSRDARVLSLEERRLYLMRYMDEANKHKQSKRAAQHGQQPSTAPSAAEPTATPSPPPVAPVTAYPPFSTHALAEALLTESSSSLPRVPLSSLPAMIVSHCSPPQSMLSSSSKDSSALLRLRSMCSEPSAALLCRAFADLHSRGSVVTAGQQYGGELLLYADEPSSCHAHSIVSVRSAARSSVDGPAISALDLLIVARIASAVSKGVVLAYEAEGKEGLAYLTLHWHPALSAAT